MTWFKEFATRFGAMFRKQRLEQEMNEEMRAHVQMLIEENVRHGMSPEEARGAALREFGGMEQTKVVYREQRGLPMIETIIQDLRYGLRMLANSPGFTALVVAALALGIGANAAMFAVINAALLRPLPFRNSGRLVAIDGIPAIRFNGPHTRVLSWEEWVGKSQTLQDLSIYEWGGLNVTGIDQPMHLPAVAVSEGFFRLLGVEPIKGRAFLSAQNAPARAEAVISYDLWQSHLGADPNIVGRNLDLSGTPFIVIGVMPPGFEFPGDTQIWIPAALNQEENLFGEGAIVNFQLARLKPGATLAQARAELTVFVRQLHQGNPAPFNPDLTVTPLRLQLVKDLRPTLLVLMGAAGLVLLIACADVATLLLARNVARAREFAVRAAVGAGRGRLIRQLLTESVLLSLAGGIAGLLVAVGAVPLARAIIPPDPYNMMTSLQLDGWVLGFGLGAALLTGILSGLLPALGSSRVSLSEAMKQSGSGVAGGFDFRRRRRMLTSLGMSEVALALVLVISATLLVRSLARLSSFEPGFRTDHLLTARLFLSGPGYNAPERRDRFFAQVLDRASKVAGVRDVGWTNSFPLGHGVSVMFSVGVEGSANPKPETSNDWALYQTVSPAYFRAMGIPLLAGRAFNERDRADGPKVAIVNQAMARRFWAGTDPLGKRFTKFDPPQWVTVVGVVGDVLDWGSSEAPEPAMYFPIAQEPPRSAFLVVHTSGPVSTGDITNAVHAVEPSEPLSSVITGEQLVARATASPRVRAWVLGAFAALAVALALVGVYGIFSFSVSQRTHEIGIRMALGAERREVVGFFVRQALRLTVAGVALGAAGAWALTRFLAGLLYGVRPADPATFLAVSVALTAVAVLAAYVPTRRATKVDPMEALRYE
ncbi:MAG TPA: ABC transporter permease [Terriglobia bacterium]|nr:ABC transporter permease [Terriglobia bacterium]